MTIPGITQTIRDGALGLQALGSDLHCKIGLCTSGDINTPAVYADPQAAREALVAGTLVESVVDFIERTKLPVMVVRAQQTAAGVVGSVSQVGSGPLMTASGAPVDTFQLRVEILVGGSVDEATFRWSLDGGDTWSQEIAVGDLYEVAEYEIPDSGITIAFPAGTYVIGTVYSAACTAPSFDLTSLAAAMDAAIEAPHQYRLVHIVGYAASASASAAVAAAVASKASAAEGVFRYIYAVVEMADDSDANLLDAFASIASVRVARAAGFCEYQSAITGRVYKRPIAWPAVARIMAVSISRDPGAVEDGDLALTGVRSLYRDEDKTPGLHDAGFLTMRTFKGYPGFHVTAGRMSALATSDYAYIPNRQVMDVAARVTYEALLPKLNTDLVTQVYPGPPQVVGIAELEARRLEARVLGRLRAALMSPTPPHASDVSFSVSRTEPILQTQTIRSKTRIRPKGYARYIENELAFSNPALEPS